MITLWNKNKEEDFFTKSLEFAQPEQLFYLTEDSEFFAYWPKSYEGPKSTLQSRNTLIGQYTEKWVADLFDEIAKSVGGYSVQGVVSEEIGLTKRSPADIAICKTEMVTQNPRDILMIVEVKMSVVWNWQFTQGNASNFGLTCVGDHRTHKGNPGLLRSDSMLKAIGKSINIRVSSLAASKIPIVILGNTPITESYYEKVDHLKKSGIVQGFWSVNPKPLDDSDGSIKNTPSNGFYRFDDYEELKQSALELLKEERSFFSSMQTEKRLGEIIEIASKEGAYEAKAQRFLELLGESDG